MSLDSIDSRSEYTPGVYMLMGVNGIGKSTIVDRIAADNPEVVPMHASKELSALFGGITREEMESLRPDEKLAKMVVHFTSQFDKALDNDKAIILDTHLLVPIRKDGLVAYEDIWSDAYTPYTTSAAILSAHPSDIRSWRLRDEADTGRKRNTEAVDIQIDQDKNLARFKDLQETGSLPEKAEIVNNHHGSLSLTRLAIEEVFRSTK